MKSLKERSLTAGVWASAQTFVREFFKFVVFLLLARFFLNDDDFGLVALANAVVLVIQQLGSSGLNTPIIQKKNISDAHLSAAFWMLMTFSLGALVLLYVLSGYIAIWVDEPRVSKLLKVLAFTIPITFLGVVHESLLRKRLDFKPLAFRSFVASIVGGSAGILAAFLGCGVWSLVVLSLVTVSTSTTLLWMSVKWTPDLKFPLTELKELLDSGVKVSGITLTKIFGENIDRFIVTTMLGIAQLGTLYVAQRLIQLLQTVLTQSIIAVAFPAFSEIQDDLPRVRKTYLDAVKLCSIVSIPLFLGLSAVSEIAIPLLIGEKWAYVSTLVTIFAIGAALSTPTYFCQPLLISLGKSGRALNNVIIGVLLQSVCIFIGARWGLEGVCYGFVAQRVIMLFVWFIQIKVLTGVHLSSYVDKLKYIVAGAVSMFFVARALIHLLTGVTTDIVTLIVSVVCSCIYYFIFLYLFDSNARELGITVLNVYTKKLGRAQSS